MPRLLLCAKPSPSRITAEAQRRGGKKKKKPLAHPMKQKAEDEDEDECSRLKPEACSLKPVA